MIKIFVINLKKDKNKRENVSKLLNKFNIKFEIIDAVYGNDLTEEYKNSKYTKEETIKNIGREMSNGELGCALSHYQIYEYIVNKNIEKSIILEDDILINQEFKNFLSKIDSIPKEIELLLLGYHSNQHTEQKTHSSYWGRISIDGLKFVKLIEIAYGTYGYYITKEGAKKLYNEINLNKISRPIDHYTGELNICKTYATSERLVYFGKESINNSSIKSDRSKKIYLSRKEQLKAKLRKYLIFRIIRDTIYELKFFIKALNPRNIK